VRQAPAKETPARSAAVEIPRRLEFADVCGPKIDLLVDECELGRFHRGEGQGKGEGRREKWERGGVSGGVSAANVSRARNLRKLSRRLAESPKTTSDNSPAIRQPTTRLTERRPAALELAFTFAFDRPSSRSFARA